MAALLSSESKILDSQLLDYLNKLYDVSQITENDFKLWSESYSYKGFNKDQVLNDLKTKVPDPKISQQIILICGLNGPVRAAKTKLLNGRTVESYGIPSSGLKGSTGISCQRITAATADLCAYLLKKINAPKRIKSDLPGWLQFPGAGSIKLPENYRVLHHEFTQKFSQLIGGTHNEQIYNQMNANAYLDERLHLF